MAVEINTASERLQLKHKATDKWTEAFTPLQVEDGYGIRLITEQMQEIDDIAQKVASLVTKTDAQDIQKVLKTVDQSLGTLVTQGTTQGTNVISLYQSMSDAIANLTQLATASGTTNQTISTRLATLSDAITSLNTSLSNSSSSPAVSTGETEVEERIIAITSPGQVQPCQLPNNTKSLVFSGRKDNLERSYDIYWSFRADNMTQGKYKILWAYNEFAKSGLNFKDKILYLSCTVPIQIDVCTYYS
jgi:hypothetical protein